MFRIGAYNLNTSDLINFEGAYFPDFANFLIFSFSVVNFRQSVFNISATDLMVKCLLELLVRGQKSKTLKY